MEIYVQNSPLVCHATSDRSGMGMLDRYKKKGGFFQLLQLLETSPQAKREQFLTLIANESPVWEEALRKRILTINRVYSWDGQYLVEIFSRLQPLTLASALVGNPPDEVDKLLSCLPPISKRKISDLMAETHPSPGEKATSISKILTEVRGFIAQGIIKMDKIDPEIHIPENIEEVLAVTSIGGSLVDSLATTQDFQTAHSESDSSAINQEVEFLRRKMNHLVSEVNALKHENTVLKDKLAQIKRIA